MKAAARQSLTCIKNKKNMANDFQYGGWNCYTLQCGMIMTLISTGDCTLQCSMWLWNCGSTPQCDTWLWYDMPLNSPNGSTLQCETWLWNHGIEFASWKHHALWQVGPNVRHIRILHLVSISIMSPQKQLSADMQYIIPTNQACKIVVTHARYINRAFALHCYHRMPS